MYCSDDSIDIQICPVSEGFCEKYRLRGEANFQERREKFVSPRNRYFSQITLTNKTYLFNSAEV